MRALFARDEHEFWFNHFTDEEKQLKKMSVWQLAEVINEENVHSNNPVKKIVAEHAINHRLAKLQANASFGSALISFIGGIICALLTVWLTTALAQDQRGSNATDCVPKNFEQGIKTKENQSPIRNENERGKEQVTPAPEIQKVEK
jgi:hypothetical protein